MEDYRKKIKDLSSLKKEVAVLKARGKRIVFTNGCFDLLHRGHVRYLEEARDWGDILVVAVNSDHSVRQIKGPSRPILNQEERSEVLAALHCVDVVIIFEEPDPLAVIEQIRPDVLVKGADWSRNQIIGADFVESIGGRVVQVPFLKGASTTGIIERIVANCLGRHRSGESTDRGGALSWRDDDG